MSVLPFRPRQPMTSPATPWLRLRSAAYEYAHHLLNRLGVPGAIRTMRHHDPLTGHAFAVHVGLYYTTVTVDGRDYYFDRLTGAFDGTGSSIADR
jgi:hypothetical protein